jgi:hypothetical protein
MIRSKNSIAIVWILTAFVFGTVSEAGQATIKSESVPRYQPKFYPFNAGERATYRATWNGIPVGSAEIRTIPLVIDGNRYYQVRVIARSSKLVDLLFRMRDTITSTFEAKSLSPSRFVFNQRENSRIIDTDARFDSVSKKWAVHRQQGDDVEHYEFDSGTTLDPITAVYLSRSVDFKVGDHLYFHVFGGKYRYLLELYVERRETIELSSGKVEAFKIVPRVTNITKKGYASRLKEAAIWISADERRIPVMLSSKIFVGSVYMEKVEAQPRLQSTATGARRPSS